MLPEGCVTMADLTVSGARSRQKAAFAAFLWCVSIWFPRWIYVKLVMGLNAPTFVKIFKCLRQTRLTCENIYANQGKGGTADCQSQFPLPSQDAPGGLPGFWFSCEATGQPCSAVTLGSLLHSTKPWAECHDLSTHKKPRAREATYEARNTRQPCHPQSRDVLTTGNIS